MERIHKRYLLNGFSLAPDEQLLTHHGNPVHLPKRPFQVLLYLVENRDRFISRGELLDRFWDGKDVYDDALRKSVGAIRKALNENSDNPRFIETRWGVGYRYIGPIQEMIVGLEQPVAEIQKTRGVKIVVEEEEIDDQPPAVIPAYSNRKRYVLLLAAVALLVTVGVTALILFRRAANTRTSPAPITSIAVLPLKNLTGDPANDYLSDGITESLITRLSKAGNLKVISRGSAFSFKDKDLDPKEAAQTLHVQALLEGSLSRSGERLRVNVRLVSTSDGEVLWAGDSSDRQIADIFAIQDEIAANISTRLGGQAGNENRQQAVRRYTANPEAYQNYLKGRYFVNKRTPEGILKSIDFYKRAIELDPSYALAHAALAESYDKAYFFIGLPPQEVIAKQKAAATKALQLDDSLAEGHVAMATVYANTWDLQNAAREEERAIAIDPLNVEAHHNYAYRLIDLCRPDEAVAEIKRARELDPLNIVMNIDVGEILFFARRHDEAIVALLHAREMDPNRANIHWNLARIYEEKGMYAEAVDAHLKEYTLLGDSPQTIAALEEAFRTNGIQGFWRQRIQQLRSREGYIEPMTIADLYIRLGDKDQAFAWLEKAYSEHNPFMVGLKSTSRVDPLRSDPRYADLLRRVGLV